MLGIEIFNEQAIENIKLSIMKLNNLLKKKNYELSLLNKSDIFF